MTDINDPRNAAADLVKSRIATHGNPLITLDMIAVEWTKYIRSMREEMWTGVIDVDDVCNMMILLKKCRAEVNPDCADHGDDIEGYKYIKELWLKARGETK